MRQRLALNPRVDLWHRHAESTAALSRDGACKAQSQRITPPADVGDQLARLQSVPRFAVRAIPSDSNRQELIAWRPWAAAH